MWFLLALLSVLASASAQPCEAGFHTFDHPLLATDPVCVPDSPERVVVADFAAFDVMYTLGLPAAAYSGFLISNWYTNMVPELMPAITAYLGDAADVGGPVLNLEALLQADPDLILVNSLLVPDAELYAQLSAVAPTVVKLERSTDDWRTLMRFYADALGVAGKMETRLAGYEARARALRQDAAGRFAGKTLSLVQVNDPATLYLNFPSYRGWLPLREAGFAASAAQQGLRDESPNRDTPNLLMSRESVGLLDTDYLVLMDAAFDAETSSENRALVERYRSDPLWGALPAVRDDRLYLVDLAWQANGLVAAHAVIDDMYRLMLGRAPSVPNPYRP